MGGSTSQANPPGKPAAGPRVYWRLATSNPDPHTEPYRPRSRLHRCSWELLLGREGFNWEYHSRRRQFEIGWQPLPHLTCRHRALTGRPGEGRQTRVNEAGPTGESTD